ncbi:MAG: M14 family zinc carboxypeptidase [Melioribacteraceae bacterium]|nr:M14 family zinc carboxypeptidase [Melioribacteraceae bacterium]
MLDNYETNDEVKYLVENREMYFIPVVNPDGYAYNEQIDTSGGGMWRKNRSNNGDGTYGVDLNRNYGPEEYWDAPNGGSSTNTSSATYRGTEPFSEPELIAIREFLNNREIRACLNYHTYSNLLIYPYGALVQETPDSNIFREFAVDMTAENYYSIGTDQQTVDYSTRGNSDDYMYDGEPGREKIFAMTPEVGNFDDGFWPEEDRIIPLAEENLLPNLYYANIVGGYPVVKNIKVDKEFVLHGEEFLLTPLIKNKGLSETGQFEISILPLNTSVEIIGENSIAIENIEERAEIIAEPGFNIQVYSEHNLEELSFEISIKQNDLTRRRDTVKVKLGVPIVLLEDNADSLELYWDSPGFTTDWGVTDKYAYSGDKSYTDSRYGNYTSSNETSLTLLEEIDLTGLGNAYLSFWTRYQIESVYDGGVVGISADSGATWNYVGGNLAKPIENYFPDWYEYDFTRLI